MIAIEIFNSIASGVDGTLDTVTVYDLPTTGYFVGGHGKALVFESLEEANKSTALKQIIELVEDREARFIGWWADSETGKIYVDGTSWHETEFEAGRAARERREIAFWDIARERELRLAYVDGE